MLDPDATQAEGPTTASGQQRAAARRFFVASLRDGDRSYCGQGNRMRKMKLAVSESVTFDSKSVTMPAELGIAADIPAVDREPDVHTRVGVDSGLAVVSPFFQWSDSSESPMRELFESPMSEA
jgi:hypothetical protein